MRRLLLSPAAALAMLMTAPAGAAAADVQVAGFVAVTDGAGSMQISSFRLDGSHERRLTTGPANHHYPSISADGRRMLFVGDDNDRDEVYSLVLSDPNSRPQQVTAPPLIAESPSWSPSGKQIAYSAGLLGRPAYDIFVAGADGSAPKQLTHGTDAGSSMPVFSPDGKRIAYINGRARNDRIWVMNVDGSAARPLTAGPLDAYPAWLDNQTVMFAREDPAAQRSAIMGVGLDGVTQTVSPPGFSLVEPRPMPGGRTYGATEMTPDGLRLVTVTDSAVAPIVTPDADGEAYSLSWIGTPPRVPAAPLSVLPFLIGMGGLVVIGAAALVSRQGASTTNERLLA